MRGKADAKLNRRVARRKPTPPSGGKVLQRLFSYLAQREPELTEEVVETIPAKKAARQKFGLTKRALRADTVTAKNVEKRRRKSPQAKSFAKAIIDAAEAPTPKRRRSRSKSVSRGAAPTAAPPGMSTAAWQAIGPNVVPNGQTYGSNKIPVVGRVSCMSVDPINQNHLLVGAAAGGIWESTNGGQTWSPRTDQLPSLAIGAIAFDPSKPKRVYAGSGEGNFYANLGAGVYTSANGGATWSVLAQAPFVGMGFYRLVVDPANPKILYAGTTNGFFKSTNGGSSWSAKRSVRCWDVSVHPTGGATEILASFADGLFVSTNAGNTFTPVALPSAPAAAWARLAVDRVVTTPDVAYVFGAAGTSGFLWRRQGTLWSRIPLPASMGLNIGQAWYDWYVAANPRSVNQVFLGAIDTHRGDLTGAVWKWTNITTQGSKSIHPDQHSLTFAPNDPRVIYLGNDGGLYRSRNSGGAWDSLNDGLAITEIEYIAGNPNTWQWLMAGTQDNGTLAFKGAPIWQQIAMGDGGDCGVNQLNPNIIYHSFYNVSLERSNNQGAAWTWLAPPSIPSLFYPPVEVFGSTVAIGATSLLVTRTGGPPWTTVSLGLTTNEVSSAMREQDANTIIVGTNRGRVIRVNWTGTAWTRTVLTSPSSRYISCIAVDPSNAQRIWVTFSQIGGGVIYRSDNGGVSWTNCTGSLPGIPFNSVIVDPANFKRIWAAADVGVYQSLDLGATWARFGSGLPNAIAADLLIHKQDRVLFCATRSRGAWVIAVP
jgi:hypothetical protein